MSKKYYFSVENPIGEKRLILAETKWQAIAEAHIKDSCKYYINKYKAKKSK
jgi:hypothetical protein